MSCEKSESENSRKLPMLFDEQILFRGKTFEIVKQFWKFDTDDNVPKVLEHEIARRSPGVRVILNKNEKMLIIREYRFEYGDWDYRLPGGKVFDTLEDYIDVSLKGTDIMRFATVAARKELLEETGYLAKDINYLCKTKAGGTVTWDLYYFEVNNFEKSATNLEFGEIIYTCWKDVRQIKQMCIDGRIKEDRTVGVLLKYLIDKEQSID